jgi:acetylornithine deacetylase/succinyl-diaminopimelate desuccinylase-like protein
LLLDAAGARYGPAAGDNASGTAVAIALARTLAAAPPQHLTIELLLTGAGTGHELGIKQYLRAHKRDHRPSDTVVISISPCGAGNLHWWLSDGRLIPIAHARRLHELAAAVAREHPHLNAQPHRDRSATAATRARAKRVPAIAIGNLDQSGLTPRSHQSTDVIDTIDQQALTRAIEFGLLLTQTVDAAIPA